MKNQLCRSASLELHWLRVGIFRKKKRPAAPRTSDWKTWSWKWYRSLMNQAGIKVIRLLGFVTIVKFKFNGYKL